MPQTGGGAEPKRPPYWEKIVEAFSLEVGLHASALDTSTGRREDGTAASAPLAKRHRKDGSGYALLLAVPAPVLSLVRHPPYRVVPVCSFPTDAIQAMANSSTMIGQVLSQRLELETEEKRLRIDEKKVELEEKKARLEQMRIQTALWQHQLQHRGSAVVAHVPSAAAAANYADDTDGYVPGGFGLSSSLLLPPPPASSAPPSAAFAIGVDSKRPFAAL